MRTRQREHRLSLIAAALLLVQTGLLLWLWHLPGPPEALPPLPGPAAVVLQAGEPPPDDADVRAVIALDTLLERRVRRAAERLGRAPELPDDALRRAASSDPRPDGAAVQALIEAYARTLSVLGETLDGESAPAPPPGEGKSETPNGHE
jgi:hypothetical protein